MWQHRISIPIANAADHDFFADLLRANFPEPTDYRIIAGNLFVVEFLNDADVLHWITWLVTQGYNFRYAFIGV